MRAPVASRCLITINDLNHDLIAINLQPVERFTRNDGVDDDKTITIEVFCNPRIVIRLANRYVN